MRFLLNEKIEIFKIILEDNGDGGFYTNQESVGEFFASIKMYHNKEEEKLFVILRSNPAIDGKLLINYQNKIYEVTSLFEVTSGFLKMICSIQKH